MADKHFQALAVRLLEAQIELSHSDIRTALSDALNELYPGQYCYILDVFGDAESGDVCYSCGGDVFKAPYEMGMVGDKRTTTIDDSRKVDVIPRTVYDEEADEADHYASMEAARLYTAGDAPLSERFISKAERKAASSSDFAGKGKSFPILKPADVMAAVRSIGRAGTGNYSADTIKANIIRIAKAKGWESYLPASWRPASEAAESAVDEITGDVIPLREGAVGQDGSALLKLIAPGWGSSGYYSEAMLKRDGPKVFPAGTKNFWNHQTDAEESERPEGDLRDLASVLTENARYETDGPEGPGLYARAKVFEHFRQPVDDLAKHIGVSIRASGTAKEGEAEGRRGPIIERLTAGKSVDYVTTPGAGGKVLQLFEAARQTRRPIPTEGEHTMQDPAELATLRESLAAQKAEIAKLRARQAITDAGHTVDGQLSTLTISPAIKERVKRRILEGTIPVTEAGDLDTAKLTAAVLAEAKDECEYIERIAPTGRPVDLGAAAKPAASSALKAEDVLKESENIFGRLLGDTNLAAVAAKGRA